MVGGQTFPYAAVTSYTEAIHVATYSDVAGTGIPADVFMCAVLRCELSPETLA
jgi:hypothetical protein